MTHVQNTQNNGGVAQTVPVVQQAAGQGNQPVAQGVATVVAQGAIPQVHDVFNDPTTHPFRNAPDTQHVDRVYTAYGVPRPS